MPIETLIEKDILQYVESRRDDLIDILQTLFALRLKTRLPLGPKPPASASARLRSSPAVSPPTCTNSATFRVSPTTRFTFQAASIMGVPTLPPAGQALAEDAHSSSPATSIPSRAARFPGLATLLAPTSKTAVSTAAARTT